MSVEIPPIKCWIYELALISAYREPTHKIFEVISELLKSNVKNINKIIEIKGWSISKEIKILNHALKNQEVEELIKVRIAKGVININTLTIIYLNEYESIKFIKLIEHKLFKIPSREKTLREESTVMYEFKCSIKEEKLIFSSNTKRPTSLIAAEIRDIKYIKNSQKKYEAFIRVPNIINLKINWYGFSTEIPVRWAYNNFIQ